VTATSQPTAHCYNDDGLLTDKLTIDGSTVNASYYLKVSVPEGERHNGVAGSGFVMKATGLNSNNSAITISDDYTVIEYIEVSGYSAYDWSTNVKGIGSGYNHHMTVR
jgi:hypothetical protein